MIQEVVGHAASAATSCRRSPASPSATTSSAGRRASGARTACCRLVPGPRHARRRPRGRRLPGPRRAGPAGAARQRDARRGRCATRRGRSTSSTSRRAASRRWTSPTCSREYGHDYPAFDQIVSVCDDERHPPARCGFDWDAEARRPRRRPSTACWRATPFLAQMRTLLEAAARDASARPVDIEFAHDGKDLYLLQCRPQSFASERRRRRRSRATSPPERVRLHGAAVRLERPRARRSRTSSTSTPTSYDAPRSLDEPERRRPRRRPAQQAAAASASSS